MENLQSSPFFLIYCLLDSKLESFQTIHKRFQLWKRFNLKTCNKVWILPILELYLYNLFYFLFQAIHLRWVGRNKELQIPILNLRTCTENCRGSWPWTQHVIQDSINFGNTISKNYKLFRLILPSNNNHCNLQLSILLILHFTDLSRGIRVVIRPILYQSGYYKSFYKIRN